MSETRAAYEVRLRKVPLIMLVCFGDGFCCLLVMVFAVYW